MLKIVIQSQHLHKCNFPYIFNDRFYPIHEICEKYNDANETIISYKWKNINNYNKIVCVIKLNGPVVIITSTNDKVESTLYDNIELSKIALDTIFNS